jgi:maleylacetate reductase
MFWLNGKFDYIPHPVARILYGRGRMAELPDLLKLIGGTRAFLVTSSSLRRSGLVQRLETILGNSLVGIFDSARPHSPIEAVQDANELCREVAADVVISLGGGSCIDTAKGLLHFRHRDVGDHFPHIAIPTTLSGAEFTRAAGITHGALKKVYTGDYMIPSVVVLDPEAAMMTPLSLFLPSGLNAIHHCVEGVCSIRANGISDAMHLHAIRLLRIALPQIRQTPDDLQARGLAQVGAALSVLASYGVPMGMGHALAHAICGKYRTPHAITHAILIAPVMEFNRKAVLPALVAIAEALGVPVEGEPACIGQEGIDRIRQFLVNFEIPTRLSEIGVQEGDLKEIAQATMDQAFFSTNPRPATLEDLVTVIRVAL